MLLCVPAGEFLMGADVDDPKAQAQEKPEHKVALDAFWMDRTEATNANYARCVAAGVCVPRPAMRGATGVASSKRMNYYYDAIYADYPVLVYLFEQAETYCRWAGRRLPTEAEWEKSARGTGSSIYPWGEEQECSKATFFGCSDDTSPVESYAPGASGYGVLNLAGNVWEWVADRYAPDYYSNAPASNPTGPTTGEYRVRRGGGWRSLARDLRVTTRASGAARHYFDGQMGFRCALDGTSE